MNNIKIDRFEFQGNKLKIYTKDKMSEVVFPHIIDMVTQCEDILVVLLLMDDINFNENVYGVSAEGKILWQIEPVPYAHPFSPYTNLSPRNELVKVFNLDGTELIVDPETGRIICETYNRW